MRPPPGGGTPEKNQEAQQEYPTRAQKRVKVTGSGKIKKQQAGMRHNLEGKSSVRTRRLNQDKVASAPDTKVIKKLLGR